MEFDGNTETFSAKESRNKTNTFARKLDASIRLDKHNGKTAYTGRSPETFLVYVRNHKPVKRRNVIQEKYGQRLQLSKFLKERKQLSRET